MSMRGGLPVDGGIQRQDHLGHAVALHAGDLLELVAERGVEESGTA